MSCNGCRVLRKGCSESCILRPCLQWIDTPESQGHATVFVAKFFGRAGLVSFISSVPPNQRPALFQSLLYEACGRTVNPVSGAVGLLWTGNWHLCQAAVDSVLRGNSLRPISEFLIGAPPSPPRFPASDENSDVVCPPQWRKKMIMLQDLNSTHSNCQSPQLDLSLTPPIYKKLRPDTPSLNSEESTVTISLENSRFPANEQCTDPRLLDLFF